MPSLPHTIFAILVIVSIRVTNDENQEGILECIYSLTSEGIMPAVVLAVIGVVDKSGVDVPERDCARAAVGVEGVELRFDVFEGFSRGRSPV